MGSYSMFRPHNSAGNGASVWAPDEPTAAQVFVTAGVELGTDADLGPLDDLERTGILVWVVSDTDPHWVLHPIDLDEGAS